MKNSDKCFLYEKQSKGWILVFSNAGAISACIQASKDIKAKKAVNALILNSKATIKGENIYISYSNLFARVDGEGIIWYAIREDANKSVIEEINDILGWFYIKPSFIRVAYNYENDDVTVYSGDVQITDTDILYRFYDLCVKEMHNAYGCEVDELFIKVGCTDIEEDEVYYSFGKFEIEQSCFYVWLKER